MQAALQQWGRAFFHITRERRSAVIALAESGTDYLLRDPEAFDVGKEVRSLLFTDKYLQSMLNDANQDNTFAQAAKVAATAAAAIVPRRSNSRRVRTDQSGNSFHQPRYESEANARGGRGGRGRRSNRARGQCSNAWLQSSQRYIFLNFDPLGS